MCVCVRVCVCVWEGGRETGREGGPLAVFNTIQIQFKIAYTTHSTHTNGFFAYDLLKRERAEDRAYVGSFPIVL